MSQWWGHLAEPQRLSMSRPRVLDSDARHTTIVVTCQSPREFCDLLQTLGREAVRTGIQAWHTCGAPRRAPAKPYMTADIAMPNQLRRLLGDAARFLGLGVVSYGLGIAISAFLREVAQLSAETAVAIALAILIVVNFWLSRRYVFRAGGEIRSQFLRFLGMAALMRGVEYALFFLLYRTLALHYLVALTVGMGLSACMKFFLYRGLVFGGSRSAP
jgi:putative flippase GtrA